MTLRRGALLYVILIHVILAACGVYLFRENRLWLFLVEGVFVASLLVSALLYRRIFRPTDVWTIGSEFIKEQDFQSRFRAIGHPEVDRLIQLYNTIAESLEQEKIKLQEQEYFLARLLEASPAGIVTFDLDRRIDLVNPAARRILGIKEEMLKGRSLQDLNAQLAKEIASLAIGDSTVITVENRKRIKCWKSHFLDRGFPREFIMFEELTEELRRIERASYEKLIRLMSHEVNNSIGAANSLLHSALHYKDQIQPNDRVDFESALQVAISRTEHLSNFMKVYADLVRLPPPQLQAYDLVTLLRDVVRLFEPELTRSRIAVDWLLASPSLVIPIDIAQMEQVIVNILKNAIEAIEEDGCIRIAVSESGGRRFMYIEDSGPGITIDVKAKLFTPFYTTKSSGQGIGLTLASEVLQQHGFAFSLNSDSGHARFCIDFN